MKYLYLQKQDLGELIKHLKKKHKVVAPVKKENLFAFSEVATADEISLDYIPTILPPKKYLFPQKQTLGSFKMSEVTMEETSVDIEPTIIFGAHTCDIDGLACLDAVFNDQPNDPYFIQRKKSVLIIGYECMGACDEYATCITMDTHNPKSGYDIMITDAKDKYILHVNSQAGSKLVDKCSFLTKANGAGDELAKLRTEKVKKFDVNLKARYEQLPELFKASYKSKVWDDVGKRCVSCGNCTAVCPTCYCFDIYDEVTLDMQQGERKRIWDSCQLDDFAAVAGGENFRKERSSRQRHRYFRKFDYPVSKYNKFFCTGCGRCTRTCMAKISLVETVNDLTKEQKDV